MREQGYELTDEQWERIRPLLPPPARTGRPRADDQKVLNGILYVLRTGCAWKEMPREYGVCNGMAEVEEMAGGGGMDKDLAGVPLEPGRGKEAFVVTGVPRRQLRPGKKGGEEVGLTKVGKGTKRMLVVDGNGIPPAPSISQAEVELAQETLERVRVPRRRGRPRKRPRKLVADKAYDCDRFRGWFRSKGGDPLHTSAEEPQRPAQKMGG